ncbi:unnamed protein product [Lathyrus oleraceus]|uniref:BHLH domain-containing protein n=1 Tax=Pisum sativum TaxID=3888 RepID=A0A9D5A565_PEA|nr:transcription factor RSL2-like [Pisum sativum]KAI5393275.1 hypothetical protein KIW84_060406 [Pisum sativum]
MELIGSFPDGEWDFFSKMFASEDHEHYSQQFLDQNSLLLDDGLNNESQSTFCSVETGEKECMFYSFDHANISNSHYISQSQENSYGSNCSANDDTNYYFSHPNQVLANNMNSSISMDEKLFASFVTPFNEIVMEENAKLNEDAFGSGDHILEKNDYINTQIMEEHVDFPNKHDMEMHLKRKLGAIEVEVPLEEKINNNSEKPKKKPRVSKDGMKNARSKKKLIGSNEEENEEINNSSSSNISEDENGSQENSGGTTLNSNGKTRASRGSATDPQSLYARKRRERINERLRILQNLVPNGTKVDISTMLEEAVNYVKFLQVQIKLLSSDDMWMYAPLAYNGLDIGLNLNLNSSLPL